MSIIGRRKQYVEVLATHYIDGSTQPRKITLANGACFDISAVMHVRPTQNTGTGEIAIRYTVEINGQKTFLYNTNDRWFVQMKEI